MRTPGGKRDWTNLGAGPAGLIADRILANDIADYVRFRAVCSSWRTSSDDPRGPSVFDRRYHPHLWIISVCGWQRRLLNVSTGELINLSQPDRRSYLVLGPTAEGLLLLCRKSSLVVQLLNPLTDQLTDLPCADTLINPLRRSKDDSNLRKVRRLQVLGAGMAGDSMIALLFRECDERHKFCSDDSTCLAVAKPGDESWIRLDTSKYEIVSGLPFAGRFYCATSKNVMVLQLQQAAAASHQQNQKPIFYLKRPRPQERPSPQQPQLELVVAANYEFDTRTSSYISLAENNGELILTRCYPIFLGQRYKMREVYRVDLDAGKTVAMSRVDGRAVFVGPQGGRALSVRAGLSPSISANTIYFCTRHQTPGNPSAQMNFDTWHVLDGSVAEDCSARCTCSIVQHLVSYVLGCW